MHGRELSKGIVIAMRRTDRSRSLSAATSNMWNRGGASVTSRSPDGDLGTLSSRRVKRPWLGAGCRALVPFGHNLELRDPPRGRSFAGTAGRARPGRGKVSLEVMQMSTALPGVTIAGGAEQTGQPPRLPHADRFGSA